MRPRSGFTIVELLLTLLLIAGVAAVTVTIHFRRSEVTLENAAVLLAHDLRAAQNRAAYLGRETHVLFDDGGYRVTDEAGFVVSNPRNDLPFVREYPIDAVFEGVFVERTALGDAGRVVYDARGRAESGGEIVLGHGDDTRVVGVEVGDGGVYVLGSTSGWVDRGY